MKISNSKKELARIIGENGGWRDGAEFTAQDGDGTGSIDFFKSKPRYDKDDKYWRGEYDYRHRIKHVGVTIKNFHQTILSSEEYFHLYPAPDADGWIEWNGGECPVSRGTLVDVKYENGITNVGVSALTDKAHADHVSGSVGGLLATNWDSGLPMSGIIAYRLHNPEQSKPEFCESVTRSIPEPESKPTIEQLAADYRNRKDYADRKQAEADAAKADAEAKLEELVAAGKAIGLVVSIAAKPVYTGKFHSEKHGDKPSSLDAICDGCGKRFGTHVGFDCRP
ncbi:MAG: hypothetical protein ACRCXB_27300 [Aeromonadaceae bacterium]